MEQSSASPATEIPSPERALEGKSLANHASAPAKKRLGGVVLERPGMEAGIWERWYLPESGNPERMEHGESIPQKASRLIALPSSSLFSWPLWIAAEGDGRDLVKMELAGRHLLKRGMEENLAAHPILQSGDRRLVLAITLDEPFLEENMPEGWKNAARFELPARVRNQGGRPDMILWEEQGVIQAAFYREAEIAWFCALRLEDAGTTLKRSAMRLLSEGILHHSPTKILLEGMTSAGRETLSNELAKSFPKAVITLENHPPSLPPSPIDLPPMEARRERQRKQQSERLLSIGSVAAILYLLLLAWGAGDLLIRQNALKRLRGETSRLQAPAQHARAESDRWTALRPAIDPSTYPLDLLAGVAAPTEGGKVRLTNFNLELDRLQISGEATDVTQAYAFIEQLKKNPLLQEYEWTAGQPQLAGKNSVKFDMEGIRAGASRKGP